MGIIIGFLIYSYSSLSEFWVLKKKGFLKCVKSFALHISGTIVLPFVFTGLGYAKDCFYKGRLVSYELYFVAATLLVIALLPLALIFLFREVSLISQEETR